MEIVIDTIWHGAKETWLVAGEMAPYLLFGFLAAGILSVIISPEIVRRHLGKGSILSVLKASLFGIPLPLCSCGVIPVAASLRKSGASRGASTAFLLSTPQTGVDSILVTYSLLGPVFAVFRPVAALAGGMVSGLLVNGIDRDEDNIEEPVKVMEKGKTSLLQKIQDALLYGFYLLPRSIGKPVLAGLLVAGLIAAAIPDDFFAGLLGAGLGGMLAMMTLGIPVYVCSTASVPIAAALMMKGVSPGAALVFLMTGPATNAAALATVWKVMGRRTTLIYLGTVAFSALAAGLVLDYIFSMVTQNDYRHAMEAHVMISPWIKTAAVVALLCVIGFALLPGCVKGAAPESKTESKKTAAKEPAKEMMTLTMNIEGMSCAHCENTITKALTACAGVDSAKVSASEGTAVVQGEKLDEKVLAKAVEEVGYSVAGVEK